GRVGAHGCGGRHGLIRWVVSAGPTREGIMGQWQAMHRDTGRHIGTPRTASREEMEDRAARLPGVVWYNLASGDVADVVYAPYSARDRFLSEAARGAIPGVA